LERQLQLTSDGSHTLFVPELNEHYHSVHGAIQEAIHIFIQSGFNQIKGESIHILEIGFGTGLNTLLTFREAQKRNIQVHYTGIELFPVDLDIVKQLNYCELIDTSLTSVFEKIHSCEWENQQSISDKFILLKLNQNIEQLSLKGTFDLVYFDAFAPDIQPELWSEDVFKYLFQKINSNGILVTYSAKGIVKQALRKAGFFVKRLPGPQGKRHIVRAEKIVS